ncbi:MAG: CoA transferase, partial [Promethearchaeota archaeon]
MPKIFEELRILDCSQFISGPWASTFFADQGAEVIKIEPPPFGESFRLFTVFDKSIFPLFSILNRGKKSVSLDLR